MAFLGLDPASVLDVVAPSLAIFNVGLLAGVFIRLGEVHQRMKGIEWRLHQLEARHTSPLIGR